MSVIEGAEVKVPDIIVGDLDIPTKTYEREYTDDEYARMLLERAADRLERDWCQGAFSAWGKVCAVGAIGSITRNWDELPKKRRKTIRRLAEMKLATLVGQKVKVPKWRMRTLLDPVSVFDRERRDQIIRWNDCGYTRKEDVVRMFREAAAK